MSALQHTPRLAAGAPPPNSPGASAAFHRRPALAPALCALRRKGVRCDAAAPQNRRRDAAAAAASATEVTTSSVDEEAASAFPNRESLRRAGQSDSVAEASEQAAPGPSTSGSGEGEGMAMGGSLKGLLLLNLGAALFGSNQVVIKQAEEVLDPASLSALRFLIASVVFAPQIYRGLQNPRVRRAAGELALWLFGGYSAQAQGLALTTAAHGAFTGTFTVLAVPILVGMTGRKIANSTWIAAAVAILGVGLLTTSGGDPNAGDAWCILSAILFGVHKFRSESITSCTPETTELVGVQLALVAVLCSLLKVPDVVDMVQQGGLDAVLTSTSGIPWGALAFMGIGTTALTLLCEMEAMKEVSAPMAALIYSAEPLWGALFAWWLGGERWGGTGWIGAALIVGSSVYSQVAGDESEAKTAACPPAFEEGDAVPSWETLASDVASEVDAVEADTSAKRN